MPIIVAAVLLAASAVVSAAQSAAAPVGVSTSPVLQNPTLDITRVHLAPGAREALHAHSRPALVVLLSRGEIETFVGGARRKTPCREGDVEYIAAGTPHAAANVGTTPLDALVIALKGEQPRSQVVNLLQSQPGLTRTLLFENGRFVVTRLELEPEVREALHTHGYDMVLVTTTAGSLDLQVAERKNIGHHLIGDALFIPRGAPHATANVGVATMRLLGVAVK